MKCITHIHCMFIAICLLCLTQESLCIDPQYQVCKNERFCGNQIIQFPFYVEEAAYCGYPGYKLICMNNDYLLLNIDEGAYRVDEIFYSNHSLRVSNALSLDIGLCSLPKISNLHLPSDGRFLLDSSLNLILSSNCTPESSDRFSKYKVGCDLKKNETDWILAMRSNDLNVSFAYEACRSIVLAPVDDDTLTDDYMELLRNGFVLKYRDIDCSECRASGGVCGYNAEPINEFKCFCANQPHSRSCKPDNKTRLAVILGTAIPGACIVAFLCIACILWRHRRSKHHCHKGDTSSDIKYGSYFGVHVFSYKELELATNNFDPSKELGEGGFGTVYYGKLRDGREVAVKRCYESNYRRVEQFLNEIHILTLLRHRNLVLLYGSTSHQSCDLLLVYEYISNGTLADHIHGDKSKSEPLTWPVRMNIAIETASALSYLHKSDIIHRDVKTNNILLDNNFCVKVADFGLSRLFPTDVTHVSTAPQGTPGYVDPEYHQCYQLTDKSDVYSFGVVLVELISSLPAVDISRQKSEINLANLALNRIQKCAINELIDPDLGNEASTVRMTTLVAELAFRCLQIDKDLRPTMDEVLECLEQIQGRKSEVLSPAHEMEDVAMLKKYSKLMDSPVTVTDKWISTSTTPSNSG